MRTNVQIYAKELIKSLGANDALRVARGAYEATRDPSNFLNASKDANDLRLAQTRARNCAVTANFWDNVFGVLLKKAYPSVTRKQFLSGKTGRGAL